MIEEAREKELQMRLVEAFLALDLRRQQSLIFVLAHAVEAMNTHPDLSFEDAFKKGVEELDRVVARTKEHEAKALRILRGKRRLPSSRGVRSYTG